MKCHRCVAEVLPSWCVSDSGTRDLLVPPDVRMRSFVDHVEISCYLTVSRRGGGDFFSATAFQPQAKP